MDVSYQTFMEKLEKIKQTHPVLYNVWKNVIEKKKHNLLSILNQGEKMLISTETIDDFTEEQVLLLFSLHYSK